MERREVFDEESSAAAELFSLFNQQGYCRYLNGTTSNIAMPPQYHVGQRVSFQSASCTVRYIGPVEGTEKEWLGVEWDDPTKGKHDGQHNGKRYYTCKLFELI